MPHLIGSARNQMVFMSLEELISQEIFEDYHQKSCGKCNLQHFQKGSSGFAKTGIIWRSYLLIKTATKNISPN